MLSRIKVYLGDRINKHKKSRNKYCFFYSRGLGCSEGRLQDRKSSKTFLIVNTIHTQLVIGLTCFTII